MSEEPTVTMTAEAIIRQAKEDQADPNEILKRLEEGWANGFVFKDSDVTAAIVEGVHTALSVYGALIASLMNVVGGQVDVNEVAAGGAAAFDIAMAAYLYDLSNGTLPEDPPVIATPVEGTPA